MNTPEQEDLRQRLIVMQSSLDRATQIILGTKDAIGPDDTLKDISKNIQVIALELYTFVYESVQPKQEPKTTEISCPVPTPNQVSLLQRIGDYLSKNNCKVTGSVEQLVFDKFKCYPMTAESAKKMAEDILKGY